MGKNNCWAHKVHYLRLLGPLKCTFWSSNLLPLLQFMANLNIMIWPQRFSIYINCTCPNISFFSGKWCPMTAWICCRISWSAVEIYHTLNYCEVQFYCIRCIDSIWTINSDGLSIIIDGHFRFEYNDTCIQLRHSIFAKSWLLTWKIKTKKGCKSCVVMC